MLALIASLLLFLLLAVMVALSLSVNEFEKKMKLLTDRMSGRYGERKRLSSQENAPDGGDGAAPEESSKGPAKP